MTARKRPAGCISNSAGLISGVAILCEFADVLRVYSGSSADCAGQPINNSKAQLKKRKDITNPITVSEEDLLGKFGRHE
jgi:hypothetical protein